ncbi:hypothetical protein MMC28_011350 [Mycoblastus sanguinarius]|nr:hypothetical protein [Mycoblastus sanguinarius]
MAVLAGILCGSLVSEHHEPFAFSLVAAIVQVVSCFTLATLILHQLREDNSFGLHGEPGQTRQKSVLVLVLGVLPSLFAAVTVGGALGWAKAALSKDLLVLENPITAFLNITFIVWGVSVLAQVLCYVTLLWTGMSSPKSLPQIFATDEASGEMIEPSPPTTATTAQSHPFSVPFLEQFSSSPPSLIASDGTSSQRSSFSTIQRPSSSRRGLLVRQHSYSRQSRSSSSEGPSERPSQDEGFDSWDTSGVSYHIREAVFQSKPLIKGSGLEPIPGSRSPSPAKALEGPFFEPSLALSPPQSPLPQPPVSRPNSPPSSPSDLPNFSTMFPPASSQPPSSPHQRNFSRPSSVSRPRSRSRAPSSEEHIHPLFRTSSPVPPPSASSGTVVTAAPEAGQFINERILRRMRSRSGSLPSSHSPLVRSESSPDISTLKVSPSPSGDHPPVPYLAAFEPTPAHRRKRSASFQSSIEG